MLPTVLFQLPDPFIAQPEHAYIAVMSTARPPGDTICLVRLWNTCMQQLGLFVAGPSWQSQITTECRRFSEPSLLALGSSVVNKDLSWEGAVVRKW